MADDARSETWVALLRGINVGGRNKLPMERLRSIFEGAGCDDVRTYIQSGNVAFAAKPAVVDRLPGAVARSIEAEFGFRVPVVTRSAAEVRVAVDANPFLQEDVDPGTLHVAFLAEEPDDDAVAELDPHRSPPDRFLVRGSEIYLCCPNGMARTKLTNAYFDSALDTVSTMRNWRTTLKLLEMVDG